MTEIVIDIAFRNIKYNEDTIKRAEHVFDRMRLRGISKENIIEAVQGGAKRIRKDGSIIAEYRWFQVIYREFRLNDIRKIYPITVLD